MPSIRENLQHIMTADVVQPAQRGVDALDAAQNACVLSEGLFKGVVGAEVGSDLYRSAELLVHANQKISEALQALAQISARTQHMMGRVGIDTPELTFPPQPSPIAPITLLVDGAPISLLDTKSEYGGDSPLDVTRDILTAHTDRNPVDSAAIVEMMRQALTELGADREAFSDELINVLDPHTTQAIHAQTIATINELGALIHDESASRGARWGAMSLIGNVALAEPSEQASSQETDTVANNDAGHAYLTRQVARQVLQTIIETDGLDMPYRATAQALLSQTGFSTEDVAIDLALNGFHESKQMAEDVPSMQDSNKDTCEEAPIMGASISDIRQESIFSLGPNVRAKIEAMDWLDLDDDAIGDVRDIQHDGKTVARVVDLTNAHSLLSSLKDELENHHKLGQQFWPHLATNIIHFMKRQKLQRLSGAKVPTFYMRNLNTANENIVRAYYVPLGNDEVGVSILGLVAAYHTKRYQREVLSLITEGDGRAYTKRGRRQ